MILHKAWKMIFYVTAIVVLLGGMTWGAEIEKKIPILCYHRFGSKILDSTTIKISTFEKQLLWMKENGYSVISLKDAIGYLADEIETIPDKPVVITVDDGHKSVYFEMAPLIKEYAIPVTLFIYPSAISNTKYSMTWEQMQELEESTFFRVESHSYWHPNFKKEKRKLSPEKYRKFVDFQLAGARKKLEEKMGHTVQYLAWPYGIHNKELEKQAEQAGYTAALTIDRRYAKKSDSLMALPRIMIAGKLRLSTFENIINTEKGNP